VRRRDINAEINRILEYLREHEFITITKAAILLGCSPSHARDVLKTLCELHPEWSYIRGTVFKGTKTEKEEGGKVSK